jgi:hypothetical protein
MHIRTVIWRTEKEPKLVLSIMNIHSKLSLSTPAQSLIVSTILNFTVSCLSVLTKCSLCCTTVLHYCFMNCATLHCCTTLCCTRLYCTALSCTVLYFIVLYCTVLCCAVLYSTHCHRIYYRGAALLYHIAGCFKHQHAHTHAHL